MAERIISMRSRLYDMLTHDLKTPGEWGHIKSQIGMFRSLLSVLFQIRVVADSSSYSFTGLTPPQTKALAEKAHVYMTGDGRISMAGLNGGNIEYFARSVDGAVRGTL